jgi:hypothetical protein
LRDERFELKTALLATLLMLALAPNAALAQSGSAGGSIGNDEKSLSGTRSEPRSAAPERSSRRSKSEDEPRRSAPRPSGGGGGGNFDGAWVVVGVGTTCSGGSTSAVVISSGRIIGEGVTGTVSPSGAANAVGKSNGITIISTGRLSGRSGSGSFRQSDGCSGRWTATKS